MITPSSNGAVTSKATPPFEAKKVHLGGPHRPTASTPSIIVRPVAPVAIDVAHGPSTKIDTQVVSAEAESALLLKIEHLWQIHEKSSSSLRDIRKRKNSNRAELGERLSELKAIYAKPGRNGQWSSFLKQIKMHRSTAEGLIDRHRGEGHKKPATELTPELIPKLLKALSSKLLPVNTRELADLFLSELKIVLNKQVGFGSVAGEASRDTSFQEDAAAVSGEIMSIDDL